jgi:hypothetical protein
MRDNKGYSDLQVDIRELTSGAAWHIDDHPKHLLRVSVGGRLVTRTEQRGFGYAPEDVKRWTAGRIMLPTGDE